MECGANGGRARSKKQIPAITVRMCRIIRVKYAHDRVTYLHAHHHLDTDLNCVYTERESQSLTRLYLPKIPKIPTEVVAVRLREDPKEDVENTSQKNLNYFSLHT
jgi:hypothetical protein